MIAITHGGSDVDRRILEPSKRRTEIIKCVLCKCVLNQQDVCIIICNMKYFNTTKNLRILMKYYYIYFCLVFSTAAASKIYSVATGNILVQNPVFGFNNNLVLMAGAVPEVLLVAYIIFNGEHRKPILATLFLCYAFILYRSLLLTQGVKECDCFAGLFGYFGISKQMESLITMIILGVTILTGSLLLVQVPKVNNKS